MTLHELRFPNVKLAHPIHILLQSGLNALQVRVKMPYAVVDD